MDRNNFYGGGTCSRVTRKGIFLTEFSAESASLNLTQLYEKFRTGQQPPAALGAGREYNVDLIPKFIMAAGAFIVSLARPSLVYHTTFICVLAHASSGNLVKLLLVTDVTRYLEFKCVDGSYVVKDKKVCKVPSSAGEAFKSPLMGLFEKRRCGNFLEWVQAYDTANSKTWGKIEKCDPRKCTAKVRRFLRLCVLCRSLGGNLTRLAGAAQVLGP